MPVELKIRQSTSRVREMLKAPPIPEFKRGSRWNQESLRLLSTLRSKQVQTCRVKWAQRTIHRATSAWRGRALCPTPIPTLGKDNHQTEQRWFLATTTDSTMTTVWTIKVKIINMLRRLVSTTAPCPDKTNSSSLAILLSGGTPKWLTKDRSLNRRRFSFLNVS